MDDLKNLDTLDVETDKKVKAGIKLLNCFYTFSLI